MVAKKTRYFKCKQCRGFIHKSKEQEHICVPPTENGVIGDLTGDLLESWEKLRSFASELGEQKIYASAKAIMFTRRICYFFVRARSKDIQIHLILNKRVKSDLVKKITKSSKRYTHIVNVSHPDQIGPPITDWIVDAWALAD